jgi:hypothetical protein
MVLGYFSIRPRIRHLSQTLTCISRPVGRSMENVQIRADYRRLHVVAARFLDSSVFRFRSLSPLPYPGKSRVPAVLEDP